ncbi:MAG: hypothetical protein HW416_2573 [Chloroflexi bacterium]|nr:hypothetical protein [Chloroflexota bacterium]
MRSSRFAPVVFCIGLGLVLAACSPAAQSPSPTLVPRLGSTQGTPGVLTGALPATDLAVGPNQRFLLALIGPDNRLVTEAAVDLAFFKVTGPNEAQLRSRAPAEYREAPGLPGRGIYVARAEFDEAGEWGVAALVRQPSGEQTELRHSFQVKDRSATPSIGTMVPLSRTLTASTAAEVERFCSSRPGDAFHRLSVADALAQRKPFAVLFATPGFCESRTCGPSLDVLQALSQQYGDQMNFVHVEIYKDGRPNDKRETVPAVGEWSLTSEPWLFVVGADGRLVDKFEGSITMEEAGPVLKALLGA